MAKKTSKTPAPAGPSQLPISFKSIQSGLSEDKVVFRLIHFWEARNPNKGGLLIGLELLLIDEESTVIQGFIAPNRIGRFDGRLKANSIYCLTNFYATANKNMYRVTNHKYTICFTDNSDLSPVVDENLVIESQKFRFHSFEEFERSCDKKSDLYDVIGHVKLINGQNLDKHPQFPIPGDSKKERVSVHLQPKEGPVLNLYLWDNAASEFRLKLNARETIPSVLLVTTVNPKKIGGRVSLASMSSSRVFMDTDVPHTREYLTWLGTQETDLPTLDTSQVTKVETLTISEILNFLKTETAQNATFNCIATIDNLKHNYGWYYIGCTGCSTKVTKGATTLVCNKCNNANAMGVIKFRLEFSVHEDENEATFVFLDEAASDLIGRKAAELMDEYIEVPPPESLSEVVGQQHKFEIKVSSYNFRASRQTLTVTRLIKAEDGGASDSESANESGEANSTEENVARSSTIEVTGGSVIANNTGKGLEDTTESTSKRPRLNT